MSKKSIFVTGAASGIGKETACLFASRGWYVGLFDLNETVLPSFAAQIGPENCCWQRLDVTCAEDFHSAADLFSEQTGGTMNVLFNCAGVAFNGRFADVPLSKLQRIIRINVEGTLVGIHACLPVLTRTPEARVINMSSAAAFYGVPGMAVYSASKAAIRLLTEALNLELETAGITVSDIMPAYVNTPMFLAQSHELGSINTLGAPLTPEQVALEVWRAAHGKKVHWIPEWKVWVANAITRWSPALQREVMRWISSRRKVSV